MAALNADCSFHIGKTHHVCEDYAFANVDKESDTAIAIVSDGCSSSKNTDFGSRLLTRAAAVERFSINDQLLPINELCVIRTASAWLQKLGLSDEALDATLLCILASEAGCSVRVFGDGVVVAVKRSGLVDVYNYEYPSGMPFYLSYYLNEDRLKQYLYHSNSAERVVTSYDNWGEMRQLTHLENDARLLSTYLVFPSRAFSQVFVMSDGVHSFQRKTEAGRIEPIDFREVVKQLIAIKNCGGVFVKRRCNRFLGSFCTENGWTHNDDLSVAAVHFG
jgi:hypothetical protein